MEWRGKGTWDRPEDDQLPTKTLTDISSDQDLVEHISRLVGLDLDEDSNKTSQVEPTNTSIKEPTQYTKEVATEDLFLPKSQFDDALEALREKKNLVLQGPPGVGKTFVARRLAMALIGTNDPKCIECWVQ